ncbi:hydroxyacid dehydrogenase [Paenarthrobacter nitroguajacolicus]|uniref:hydroxyacid dehydrogenase n=1 Tax=Paenarthrobacter nitroguajacolicus TaxID=211146 RepID=UPI00248ADAFA|nr:hydroxyacid dehydrogenase [Paenarthrobacter nitroguajacolicus]MDI2036472.1 Hydroxypyruvate reductase [Paenarthrobacter nitroguajacolicus]
MTEIYISDPIHPQVLADIQGAATVHLGYGPNKVNYLQISENIDAVILRAENFTKDIIAASPQLKIIARHGVGTNNVDIDAATEQGVWVTTTPGANSNAVAEHVFALLLSGARHVATAVTQVRAGNWSEGKADLIGFELSGRTMGIIGFGAIGRRVAAIAQGFGMTVLACDPIANEEDVAAAGAKLVLFDDLITEADAISIHVPLLPSTRHMIGAQELARMKTSAFIVNTSRGGLVDEAALAESLSKGLIAGAAFDVLEAENIDMKDPLAHTPFPHTTTPGLILTPHIAGQTEEAFLEAGTTAWAETKLVLAGEAPTRPVNNPALSPANA